MSTPTITSISALLR